MKVTLGFSPCPNDTFIFDALVNHKIDTGGLEFEVVLEDVQTLNNWAKAGKLDFSKISYGVLPHILEDYCVLDSGGALGKGVGPLLISKEDLSPEKITEQDIAIPGVDTTAHLLFSLAYPGAQHKQFKVFNEIEDFVATGHGLGVIIHENRFTYQDKGLVKLIDLGDYWERTTGAPIPLGGIIARRSFDPKALKKINNLIRKSVTYAFENHKEDLPEFVTSHAQEMDESVMHQHINLYVNNFSFTLGSKGKSAIHQVLDVYNGLHPDNLVNKEGIFAEDLGKEEK